MRWAACSLSLAAKLALIAMAASVKSDLGSAKPSKAARQPLSLTHIVMPFHPKQHRAVIANFGAWTSFPPCREGDRKGAYTLLLFISSSPEKKDRALGTSGGGLKESLVEAFHRVPVTARWCIKEPLVVYGNLSGSADDYYNGSRNQFEHFLAESLPTEGAQYVFYMEPDCLPVHAGWLAMLNDLCTPPNPPFWIKGSIFRGETAKMVTRWPYYLFHINGNAIYNLASTFPQFYFAVVRPYIRQYYEEHAYDTDIFKFLLDPANYNVARRVAHLFQFTNVIQNQWHSSYSYSGDILSGNQGADVAIVHGGEQRE